MTNRQISAPGRNSLTRLAAASLCIALASPSLSFAQSTNGNPAMAQQERKPAVIQVSGIGHVNAAPDMAIINLGINERAETARAAMDANNAKMSAIFAALKNHGIEDKDFQTAGLSIQPVYESFRPNNNEPDKPPQIIAYQVFNQLAVRITDLDKLGGIMDEAVTLGVNQGGDITFTNSNVEELSDQARKLAMQNALAKAKTLTEAIGAGLGPIVRISEAQGPRPMVHSLQMAAMDMAEQKASSVPVAAGENRYSITVDVEWEISQ